MINIEKITTLSDWDVRILTVKNKFTNINLLYRTHFNKKNDAIKFTKEYMKIPSGAIAYIVEWSDYNYERHYKMFIGNPQDSPDIVYKKAQKFYNKLYKDKRYINLEQIY